MSDNTKIPVAVVDDVESWQRIFASRSDDIDARDLLRNAARGLFQTLKIDKTVHPESNGIAHQFVVDHLQLMAESAGIRPDEAQRIFAENFKANGNADNYSQAFDNHRDEKNYSWDDPDISILDDRRGELSEFPVELLSPLCRQFVERAAHGSGVTSAHVAVPLVGIASSLVGTARRAQASISWTQPLSVWTAVVGFSGSGKTPGLDTTRRPLSLVERNKKTKIAQAQQIRSKNRGSKGGA